VEKQRFDTLVMGIGNILWADEGFGVRAVEALHADYRFPANVRLMDGGTQGMFLLAYVREARRLLIFDAIDFGLKPGELRLIRDDDVPRYMGAKKISMHQTGFQEVLASASLMGHTLEHLALVGVQPLVLDDYGGSLRPQIKARIPEALDVAVGVLREWGIEMEKRVARASPASGLDCLSPTQLDMDAYEKGRPNLS
jgi:hydrogenase maturation protease